MYHHLRGNLVELSSLNAVVETSGVGWDVHVPLSTSSLLGEGLGEEVLLYTHLLVGFTQGGIHKCLILRISSTARK